MPQRQIKILKVELKTVQTRRSRQQVFERQKILEPFGFCACCSVYICDRGQIIGSAWCTVAVWINGVLNKHWLDHTQCTSGYPKGDGWIRGRGPHNHRDGAVS